MTKTDKDGVEYWPNTANDPKPLDLTNELTDIKRRLESLEARILSLNERTLPMVRLGPSRDRSPYDLSKLGDIVKKVKKNV